MGSRLSPPRRGRRGGRRVAPGGAAEAGAIWIKFDQLDGRAALYGPAASESGERGIERLWLRAHSEEWVAPEETERRVVREVAFDPDLWLVEVEDRDGRCWLDLAEPLAPSPRGR